MRIYDGTADDPSMKDAPKDVTCFDPLAEAVARIAELEARVADLERRLEGARLSEQQFLDEWSPTLEIPGMDPDIGNKL